MSRLGVTSPLRSLMILGEDPTPGLPVYYLSSVNAIWGIEFA